MGHPGFVIELDQAGAGRDGLEAGLGGVQVGECDHLSVFNCAYGTEYRFLRVSRH